MTRTAKKTLLILPLSLLMSFVAVCACYHILQEEAMLVAVYWISFCVFFAAQFVVFKILDRVLPRFSTEKEDPVQYGVAKSFNNEKIVALSDYLTIKFDLSDTAIPYIKKIDDEFTLFTVCDVVGSSVATDIVQKILFNTIERVKNPTDLQKLMKSIDISIKLLNLKGVTVSIIVGLVDCNDLKMKFINASIYDIYTFQKFAKDVPLIPLIANRYKMAAEKQLPFLTAEYQLKLDDVVFISYEERKR